MKTTKFLLMGLLLGMTSFVCRGESDLGLPTGTTGTLPSADTVIGVLTGTSTTTSTSTTAVGAVTGTENITDFLAKFQQYMPAAQLSAFITAYQENEKSSLPLSFSDFCMDYIAKNPSFYQELIEAVEQAKIDEGITDDGSLTSLLASQYQQQVKDLQEQIDDMKNLTEEEKKEYQAMLNKYKNAADQLMNQLANSTAALNNSLRDLTQPQQKDPTMMIMMILMMVMMMMKGGGK